MRDQFDIRNEINGRDSRSYEPTPAKKVRTVRSPRREVGRSRQPQAPEWSSMLAQVWCDNAAGVEFDLPYDVNYFALALEKRVEQDPVLQKFLVKGKDEQVHRWVRKMIDLWWSPVDNDGRGGYLTGEVTARNAKDYFLGEDWNDLRDYARSCLRAAYLLEHGKAVAPPVYPNQQEYQSRLRTLQQRADVSRYLHEIEEGGEPPEPRELDEEDRKRLRSFVEKRRNK